MLRSPSIHKSKRNRNVALSAHGSGTLPLTGTDLYVLRWSGRLREAHHDLIVITVCPILAQVRVTSESPSRTLRLCVAVGLTLKCFGPVSISGGLTTRCTLRTLCAIRQNTHTLCAIVKNRIPISTLEDRPIC